jgi:alkylation response protein AidB-like acyl-CoA dehydrogenase
MDGSLDAERQAVIAEIQRFVGFGYTKEFNVERYYRDAPFMLVGEGTSEIQRLVIARQLLERYKL